ncbi:MAG TPA: co-chaperone GroES family protein [Planctomycetota bacterium]|nr:co-chaperone GroES family protein [Planctomycetota bacterium]
MKRGNKQLLVVGDRVLVKPEKGEGMTKVGLFLPPGVLEKEEVRGGSIVAIGPGQPLPPPHEEHEPWKEGYRAPRFLPMQVGIGDYALFFRKAAIEITFEDEHFLVVPYGAILVLVRSDKDGRVPDQLPNDL